MSSPFCEDLVRIGGHTGQVVNIDISPTVIDFMRAKYSGDNALPPSVTWAVADVMCLGSDFKDDSFDAVIDKGTADALMCGGDTSGNVAAMCAEMDRVLRPKTGVYITITYGDPASRAAWFDGPPLGWDVLMHTVSKSADAEGQYLTTGPWRISGNDSWLDETKCLSAEEHHFVYICRRTREVGEMQRPAGER